MKKKILLILLLLGAGVLLLSSGLGDYLSLDGLKQARSQVAAFQTAHPEVSLHFFSSVMCW